MQVGSPTLFVIHLVVQMGLFIARHGGSLDIQMRMPKKNIKGQIVGKNSRDSASAYLSELTYDGFQKTLTYTFGNAYLK